MTDDNWPPIDLSDPTTFPKVPPPPHGPHVADLWEQAIAAMIDGDESDFVEMLRSGVPMTVDARYNLAEMIDRKAWGVGWYKLVVEKMSDAKIARAIKHAESWLTTVGEIARGARVNDAIAFSDEKNNNGEGTAKRAWMTLGRHYYNCIEEIAAAARRDSLRDKKRIDSCP